MRRLQRSIDYRNERVRPHDGTVNGRCYRSSLLAICTVAAAQAVSSAGFPRLFLSTLYEGMVARTVPPRQPQWLTQHFKSHAPGTSRIDTIGPAHGMTAPPPPGKSTSPNAGNAQRGWHILDTGTNEKRSSSAGVSRGESFSRVGALSNARKHFELLDGTGFSLATRAKSTVDGPPTLHSGSRPRGATVTSPATRESIETRASTLHIAALSGTSRPSPARDLKS